MERLMRRMIMASGFFIILAAGWLCLSAAEDNRPVLYVFTWEDYFSPEAVRLFEEKYGCRVEFDYYDSNENMIELSAGGIGYDVMTPPPNIATVLFREGNVIELDHGLLPNLRHLDANDSCSHHDPEYRFSVPYTSTVSGVGYDKRRVSKEALGGWSIFSDKRFAGRMALCNDMRETMGVALKFLGFSANTLNPDEIVAARDILLEWKKNISMFAVDQAKQDLQEGKLSVIMAYSGDMAAIIQADDNYGFYVPSEGSTLNGDCFVISADSSRRELAHAFINHFLDPEIAVMDMEYNGYYMPNATAYGMIDPELRANPAFAAPKTMCDKCELIKDIGSARALYDRAWSTVLLTKQFPAIPKHRGMASRSVRGEKTFL